MKRDVARATLLAAPAMAAGTALGAAVEAGGALLLYTDEGFLATFGFLGALALAAVAAGVWVGAGSAPGRGRWAAAVVAFLAAAGYAALSGDVSALRATGPGRALGVLFLLAAPAYAAGVLLGGEARRGDGERTGVAALLGAAAGVLLASMILVPRMQPAAVFTAAGAALAAGGLLEAIAGATAERRRSMRDSTVIVTGVGDRGQVGYAVAAAFLASGARVVATARTAVVEELAAELAQAGPIVGVVAELTDPDDAARVVATARERFGGLDTLINVAGGLGLVKPLADTTPGELAAEVERNAATLLVMSRAALPLLRESRGAIVNFASPATDRAVPQLGAYAAAKAAVVALTRTLALEERQHGVRVNAIAPGMIDTAQNRAQVADPASVRWVTREQVADVALFLAGPAASGITGEVVRVTG